MIHSIDCPCKFHTIKSEDIKKDLFKSSRATYGCEKPAMLQYSNAIIYEKDREPSLPIELPAQRYETLNPNNMGLTKATDLAQYNGACCGQAATDRTPKGQGGWGNKHDGRLYNSAGANNQKTYLGDRPYTETFNMMAWQYPPNHYPAEYKTGVFEDYSKVNTGNRFYYVDKNLAKPFNNPNFTLRGEVDHFLYTDPMGKVYSWFDKHIDNKTLTNYSPSPFIRDSTFAKENIMASQMRDTLQKDYASRYYS